MAVGSGGQVELSENGRLYAKPIEGPQDLETRSAEWDT